MSKNGEHAGEIIEATGELVPVQSSGNDLLALLVQKDASMEMIEKFMDLRDREEAKEAKRLYVLAMAGFKKDPPEILKTKHVEYKNSKQQTVQWDHAELGEICEAINRGLSEHDLFSNWDLEQPDEKTVVVTCTVTHSAGHSEHVTMKAPPDTSGGKDQLMAMTSTNTRLQRFTLLAVVGIAAKGMDREAPSNGMLAEYIDEEQLKGIKKAVKETGADEKRFLKFAKIERLEDLLSANYGDAIKALKATAIKKAKKVDKKAPEPGTDGC